MDRETRRLVEEFRRNDAGPIENNLIDELVDGDLDRQEFLRRASVFGLGAGTIGLLLRYIGRRSPRSARPWPRRRSAERSASERSPTARVSSRISCRRQDRWAWRGFPANTSRGRTTSSQVKPWLATSWKPNADAHRMDIPDPQGREVPQRQDPERRRRRRQLQAVPQPEDVTDPGALPPNLIEPSGVVKTGPYSVQFRLKSPNNAFPFLVSQTTYQAIIQPAAIAAKPDTWVSSGMIGTGPFRLKSQNKQRAELVRFNGYWGGKPPLDGVVITFYSDPAPMVLALRAGQLDLVQQMSPQQARAFQNNSKYQVYTVPVSSHNMFGMRVDRDPFRDARVRRAIALTLNRPDIINRVLLGAGRARKRLAVLPGIRVHRPVDPPAEAERRAREGALEGRGQGRSQVHDHDPQPVRRPGLRGRRSGRRPTGGHHDRPGRHDATTTTTRRGRRRLRDDDPVAQQARRPSPSTGRAGSRTRT